MPEIIKRELLKELKSHLSQPEVSFILGPRQAGKTTLMLFLKEHLDKKREKTLFLNLDVEADRRFFASQAGLLKKIELEIGKKKSFIFIDEIRRKENAGVFLKGIYDMKLPYKLIVSGSGSVELKEKIHESLVGRKRVFLLPTITFREFVNFKTGYKYQNKLTDFFALENEKTKQFLTEYLNFGGYPRVVLAETVGEKRALIDEIYQSYLEKDISYFLGVEKTEAFTSLVRLLASQTGLLFNFSEVSATLGISLKTLKNYLWYLEKTFIVERITPYFRNFRKEITKSPVFYFSDLGLRNYALGIFGQPDRIQDNGFLFQNFVFQLLKEKIRTSPAKIHFWRTKDGAEVDFVVDKGREVIPVEVKFKEMKKPEITRSLRSFIEKYHPKNVYVVNLRLEQTIILNKTKIHHLHFYKLKEF